ncbi:hypothetical protein B0H10DRAFT_2230963 [Mycena sp. CBHHK59/15]|nr:hypothetical protein B0H10DRAFT_2230963 [Mycena sp. CBHHK59/15]
MPPKGSGKAAKKAAAAAMPKLPMSLRPNRAATRARDGNGRRFDGWSTGTGRVDTAREEVTVFNTHGQMIDMLSYQNYAVHAWLKLTRATAVTAVFQRAVGKRTRAVTVPLTTPENPQRNGHGTRGTAAVEPWPRARAAALRPNRAKNPGLPDMAKPKRSTDEVQREKLAKEDQKREAEEKRRQGIVNAAAIENRITQEDEARDKNTNHPPTADLKKILRPRQEKPATVDDNDSSAVAAAPGDTIDPVSDGPGSSDEFELDKDNEENEDNGEDNEPVDTSEDEEAKPTKIARSKKPTKGSLRQAVDEERVKQGGRTSIREAPAKRKAPAEQAFQLQVQQEAKEGPDRRDPS